ncbi:MAG: GTPase HflX [Ignavibacteria bacterium]|nr:GTPase HflX [Ignavibacteria bacterium]
MNTTMFDVGLEARERAITIAVVRKGTDPEVVREHMDELGLLLDTAGADVVASLYQERDKPDVASAIGKGKVEEVKALVEEHDVQMVVFDDDLSPTQTRNLEEELKVKVLDRSGVILDIFASRARTIEARTQVELAQMEYMLPRLTRMWTHLSKQFGGIGTKGPGETQIETDRRILRNRIQRLREKLDDIEVNRAVQRKGRESIPRFALIGYTNAGKSSLMHALTKAEIHIEDRLFATLDTTVRAIDLPNGKHVLLSDTVGFIRKLPPQLVASFRSTLSETLEADVLIHVADVSHRHVKDHVAIVEEMIASLGVHDTPVILVFNKIDAVEDRHLLDDIGMEYPGCVFISATRSINLGRLLADMQAVLESLSVQRTLRIPYDRMKDVSTVYDELEVLERLDGDESVTLIVKVPSDKLLLFSNTYAPYIQNNTSTNVH